MGKGTPGPQGLQGPPGAPGAQGPQGPPGQVDHLQLQTALRADPQFRDNIKQALAEDPGLRNFITTYFNNNKTLFQGEKGITEFSALTSAQQAQVVALLVTNHLGVFVTELSNNATLRTALLNTMQTIAAFKGPRGDGYDHPDSANWLKQRTVWCADGDLCTLPTGKHLRIQTGPLHLLNGHPIRSRHDGFRHILQSTTQNETLRFALEGDQNVQRFASFKDDGNWTGRYPISMDRNHGTVLNINHNTGEWAAWGLQPGQNEKLGVIFKNGPTRQDDGGPKTMTIRNDDGDLRLMATNGRVTIPEDTIMQFGQGFDREVHAGQIAYGHHDGKQDGTLNIVGAGKNGEKRRVRIWDTLRIGEWVFEEVNGELIIRKHNQLQQENNKGYFRFTGDGNIGVMRHGFTWVKN